VGIPVENITPGMGLVMLRGPMKTEPRGAYGLEVDTVEDCWLQGCLLVAVAISPPFLLCHVHKPSETAYSRKSTPGATFLFFGPDVSEPTTVTIDLRRYSVGVASQAFIAAMTATKEATEDEVLAVAKRIMVKRNKAGAKEG